MEKLIFSLVLLLTTKIIYLITGRNRRQFSPTYGKPAGTNQISIFLYSSLRRRNNLYTIFARFSAANTILSYKASGSASASVSRPCSV